jgi:hypothetical protein
LRALVWTILAIATICTATQARAQIYDPFYPVCIKVYWPDNHIDCSFTSIAQCKATASGRAAECYINPYFTPHGWPRRR